MFLYFQPENIFLTLHSNNQNNHSIKRRWKDEPEERITGWNDD
jgi:hypothetical protein